MTGERYPSSGEAFIANFPISNQLQCRRYVGYCPQFDAIFELLTAAEHLKFYAMIKGLKGDEADEQVKVLLSALTLNKYKNRMAGTYSGGNKRKLSVAVSMIGNPPVIFLGLLSIHFIFEHPINAMIDCLSYKYFVRYDMLIYSVCDIMYILWSMIH